MENKLTKKFGLFTAICMVVGIVVGSGIFFKAQDILTATGGNLVIGVLSWIIGGLIMLACLLAFSCMAQKYEKVNGIVDYSEALVGPKYAYYMGWFTTFIYYPAMTSVLAWVSARYTLVFITSANPDFPMTVPAAEGGCLIGPECMVLMMFYLCMTYVINSISPKLAGKFQTTTTVIKFIPLVLMAVVGIIYGLLSPEHLLIENFANSVVPQDKTFMGLLFAAVCTTAFAYEGWIIATSINAELKNSKKNLPIALTLGGIIIISIYVAYNIGLAGGETSENLVIKGATSAFRNIFGGFLGNMLNLFIAISCLGTLNGLMLASTRGIYAVAARKQGPAHEIFSQIDGKTNMPNNSAVIGLAACAAWGTYFYLANLAGTWGGIFAFDSSELPIITIYAMYLPIFIMWMKKAKGEGVWKRFILPLLALIGSVIMVGTRLYKHGLPCLGYLIVYAAIMGVGGIFLHAKKKALADTTEAK